MPAQPVIAAQLYTLRDVLRTPGEMVATLRKVKRIGYDAAQISGVGPIEPAELRAIMLDAGVDPIGAHVGLEDFRQNLGKVIADCHAWGVGYVAIPWLPRQDFKTQQDWKRLFKEFEGYARALRREAIVVQYHNHKFEFEKFGIRNGKGGRTILEMMYEHTRLLQAELDFGWVARGGQDPAEWALKMKGRLDQVHLKDWGILDDQEIWRAIGEGGIDWRSVFKACKAAGTRHYIVEQDSCPVTNDPFLSLAISRKNIRGLGLG